MACLRSFIIAFQKELVFSGVMPIDGRPGLSSLSTDALPFFKLFKTAMHLYKAQSVSAKSFINLLGGSAAVLPRLR